MDDPFESSISTCPASEVAGIWRKILLGIAVITGLEFIRTNLDRESPWKRALAFILLGVGILVGLLWLTLPAPLVRSTFKADVEFIRITVSNPSVAGFRVGRMRALPDEGPPGPCVAGLLTPMAGIEITYQRIDAGRLVIGIDRPGAATVMPQVLATVTAADDTQTILMGPHRLEDDPACPHPPTTRLAIHGDAEFGRELRPASPTRDVASGTMSDGVLSIFVHSVDRLLGIIELPSQIYQVQQVTIPHGARLRGVTSEQMMASPVWWGMARADPDRRGLAIEAATHARRIQLVMPGNEAGGTSVVVGDFFHLAEDPNVFWVYLLISTLSALLVAALTESLRGFAAKLLQKGPALGPDDAASSPPVPPSSPASPEQLTKSGLQPREATSGPAAVSVLALLALVGLAGVAQAEPVRLTLGPDEFGQGWMFRDARGVCRIVTAAHVVTRDGRLLVPLVSDRQGLEMLAQSPVQPDPLVDVAFLEARPARPCPGQGLSEGSVSARLQASPQAYLEVLGLANISTLPLLRRARSMDDDGGRIIVFERMLAGSSIQRGMSGGAVLDGAGQPLAILIETDSEDNRARAVRIDVAAALLARMTEVAVVPTAIAGITVVHGRSVEAGRGVEEILVGGSGWLVEPRAGFVVVDLRFAQPTRIGALRLTVDEAGRGQVAGVVISGASNPTQAPSIWPPLAACSMVPGSADLGCRFAARNVLAMRLELRTTAGRFALSGLTVGE